MAEDRDEAKRAQRPFPASSFEEALELASAIHKFSSGRPIRRLTLFDQLGKSPESGPSRQLITNSAKYGLTKGSYKAEQIELTPDGAVASDADAPPRERARAQIKLAILEIPVFKALYERFVGNKLPAKQVLIDAAKEQDLTSRGPAGQTIPERGVVMDTVREMGPRLGIAPTCSALGLPRATYYRLLRPPKPRGKRPQPKHALSSSEREVVLPTMHEDRFVDLAPAEIYAQLLDEGQHLCSIRTMYRVLFLSSLGRLFAA